MDANVVQHFPTDLFELLVDGLPLLVKGKTALINLFRGAGAPSVALTAVERLVSVDSNSIKKHEIARRVLEQLNVGGDRAEYLRAR